MLEKTKVQNYVTVLSDGTLRQPVPEGTPDAVKREYELKDGTKGVKHELVFNKLTGKISNLDFFEGDYGTLLQVSVTDGTDEVILSVSASQNFGEDLMKKLPNIDLTKEVTFAPYSFEDENGKTKKGITITQDGVKVKNFFYDETQKKPSNGYPEPKGNVEKYNADKWRIYFTEARIFLIDFIKENVINKHFPKTEKEAF